MFIDAGYLNNSGQYIEDKMYFSFGLTEQEKMEILNYEQMQEHNESCAA